MNLNKKIKNNINIGNFKISQNSKCFIVAELSGNHSGKITNVFKAIDLIKRSGADAIKIQSYEPDTITLKSKNKYFYINDDSIWKGNITYFEDSAMFIQTIQMKKNIQNVSGYISYQVCSDIEGKCIYFETDFSFFDTIQNKTYNQTLLLDSSFKRIHSSLFNFIVLCFLAGFLAILTPCVFPMIPITVSFFVHKNNKTSTIKNALFYGLSIIVIFTFLGIFLSFFLGPNTANDLASNWLANILFFIIFTLFGFSLLGFFEITIPSKVVNIIDKQSNQSGVLGVFFMAFTLVLVSFSCTGPLIGGILVQSAGGLQIKPILGMLSFSIAFALPFTLLAVFPKGLDQIPKSGEWMIIIKVIMGFLSLAFAFKFLSVIDKAYHFNILDRDVFLCIWLIIFLLLTFYLMGLFSPFKEYKKSLVIRILALATFVFCIYLSTGFFGNTLKLFSAYLPPQKSTYIDISSFQRTLFYPNKGNESYNNVKYSNLFKFPHDLRGFFDYTQAITFAKKVNKPLLLDFTGHSCVNCRDIESRVWADETIRAIINNDYILVSLYVDDRTLLPEEEWYFSEYDGKIKKSIGKQNADFQITKFNNNAQPYYVVLNPYNEYVIGEPFGYDLNIENNKTFLTESVNAYYEN